MSNPFLNIAILVMLLETWNNAVIPKTEWKSKKNAAIGMKNTEEPKPPTVPRISAINARRINKRK